MPESTGVYSGLKKSYRYTLADIQQILATANTGRAGPQVEIYSKHVHATNMGLAKLIVFPDRSGIYFKETGPNTNQYTLESDVKNINKSLEGSRESGKIDQKYQYKNSAGVLAGGRPEMPVSLVFNISMFNHRDDADESGEKINLSREARDILTIAIYEIIKKMEEQSDDEMFHFVKLPQVRFDIRQRCAIASGVLTHEWDNAELRDYIDMYGEDVNHFHEYLSEDENSEFVQSGDKFYKLSGVYLEN
jgi:hypothetical protein